jgi:adenylosuccinate lyase
MTKRSISPESRANLKKAGEKLLEAKQMLAKARAAGFPVEQAEQLIDEQEKQIAAIHKHFLMPENDGHSGFDVPR